MRIRLFLLFMSLYNVGSSQSIKEVINSEISFANYAKEYNTRDAFLNFSDTSGVVFNRGKAYNVKKVFNNTKPSSSKLLWQPLFAGISASGDLGFTTGPFETRPSLSDTISGSGAYSTIWRKSSTGEWKFLIDLGIELGNSPMQAKNVSSLKVGRKSIFKDSSDVMALEAKFISTYKVNAQKAYLEYLHNDACLNLKGAILKHGKKNWDGVISSIPANLEMAPIEAGLSKAGDLAYVYGSVKHEGKGENYLRVWQNTAQGWKIVLQTLSW